MFWLIETNTQFEELTLSSPKELLAIPIRKHSEQHPGIYTPLCLYIKDIQTEEEYLINFYHSEAMQIEHTKVLDWLSTVERIFTLDRKAFNYFYRGTNTCSLPIVKHNPTRAVNYFSRRHYNDPDLGNIIPIVKHFEDCQLQAENLKEAISNFETNEFRKEVEDVFWEIERNGVKVSDSIDEHFKIERPCLSLINEYVLTQYNLKNITGRPSNNFNNINFAALNKENGCRSVFIPRNETFMEIDLVAYHPTLISKIVNYESPTGDIYEDFGQAYGMDRAEAKGLVFKQLYGNIFEQYKDFEFFKLTTQFIDKLWKNYQEKGYAYGVGKKYIFKEKDLLNMNPQKLFNYIIQNYETVNNVLLLQKILKVLEGRKSKIVLYTYDAILLDLSREDKDALREIVKVFEDENLKITMNVGKDYHSLESF
tara:strand:- start:1860 stop:3131 length:1272 start_codon:yes stop_codon:yes gene_type:complete